MVISKPYPRTDKTFPGVGQAFQPDRLGRQAGKPDLRASSGYFPMFDLAGVQSAIRQLGFDGWLLYDFRGLNMLAQRIVGLGDSHLSRRWFYFVPARGEPKK